jgi:hypothetical protein
MCVPSYGCHSVRCEEKVSIPAYKRRLIGLLSEQIKISFSMSYACIFLDRLGCIGTSTHHRIAVPVKVIKTPKLG